MEIYENENDQVEAVKRFLLKMAKHWLLGDFGRWRTDWLALLEQPSG